MITCHGTVLLMIHRQILLWSLARHDWRGRKFFRDVVEFLECSANSYSGYEDDLELFILLLVGTPEDVGDRMNDTDLEAQLLDDELVMFSQKIGFLLWNCLTSSQNNGGRERCPGKSLKCSNPSRRQGMSIHCWRTEWSTRRRSIEFFLVLVCTIIRCVRLSWSCMSVGTVTSKYFSTLSLWILTTCFEL